MFLVCMIFELMGDFQTWRGIRFFSNFQGYSDTNVNPKHLACTLSPEPLAGFRSNWHRCITGTLGIE